MNASGDFLVVWDSRGDQIAQGFSKNGDRLGGEFVLSDDFEISSVTFDPSGGFITVGTRSRGIFAKRYDSRANPVGGSFQVNTDTVFPLSDPSIGMDADGNFIIVWENNQHPDGSGWDIFGQRYLSDGSQLGTEFLVNSYTA